MFVINFTPSVTRACIMGCIGIASNLFYKKQDLYTTISLSMLIILAYNPYSVFDIGFKLSYLATLGIVLLNSNIESILSKKINNKISKILSVSISAQLLIMPITEYEFNKISLTFFISNFFASPIVIGIVLLGFIDIIISLISFKLAKLLAILLNVFLKLLSLIAEVVSKIPFGNIDVKTPNLATVILIYILILLLNYIYSIYNSKNVLRRIERKFLKIIKSKKTYLVNSIIILSIVFLNLVFTFLVSKPLKIYFIDVGQGDSTLIITPKNKKILIDGGDGKTGTVYSYLLDRRINHLDYILISHFDDDHVRPAYLL